MDLFEEGLVNVWKMRKEGYLHSIFKLTLVQSLDFTNSIHPGPKQIGMARLNAH